MLSWNVYIGNINTSKIEVYNIFSHGSFYEKLCKLAKDFRKQLKDETKIVTVWPRNEVSIKVDAYKQVMNNWEAFKEYLMNHLKEITPKNKPERQNIGM